MCQKEFIEQVAIVDIGTNQLTWDKLQKAKFEDGDCGNPVEKPKWFDQGKYLRGQKLLMDNLLCCMFCHLAGLFFGVAIEVPYTVLANTGNHNSLKALASRYLSTSHRIMQWYSSDVFDPTTEGAKSIALVRKMHTASHRTMNRYHVRPEKGEFWMSQFYMVTTQITFIGIMMLYPKAVGLGHLSASDCEAVIHYWRCIGYLLGISDKYNACGGSLENVVDLTSAFVDNLLRPSMLKITPDKFNLARGILDSILQSIESKIVTRNCFIAFWCELLQVHFNEKLSARERVGVLLMRFVYASGITRIGFIRKFLNYRHKQRYINAAPKRLSDSLLDDVYDNFTVCPYLVKKTTTTTTTNS